MKNCPNCYTDNPDMAKYCKKCGCKLRMGMKDAVEICFDKYATFSGRASRSEFWYFVLFYFICALIITFVGTVLDKMLIEEHSKRYILLAILLLVFQIIFCLPLISVAVRRLHDIGLNAFWNVFYFAQFTWIVENQYFHPFAYASILPVFIFLFMIKGQQRNNKYGTMPIS